METITVIESNTIHPGRCFLGEMYSCKKNRPKTALEPIVSKIHIHDIIMLITSYCIAEV